MTSSSIRRAALALFTMALVGCPQAPKPVEVPKAPTISRFAVDRTQVAMGESVSLSWEVSDAATLELVELSDGAITISGTGNGSVSTAVAHPSVYRLTARSEGGTDARLVSVLLTESETRVLLVASPNELVAGQSTTLVWNAPGTTSVNIEAVGGAMVPLESPGEAGSVTVTPEKTTTYRLTADTRTAEATVTVGPVIVSFAAETTSATAGQPLVLKWTTGGAEKVTLTRAGAAMPLVTETDPAKVAQSTFSDPVPATLPNGAVLQYTLSVEAGATKLERQLTVHVGVDPIITAFVVPQAGAIGGSFLVSWQLAGADDLEIALDGVVVFKPSTAGQVTQGAVSLFTPPQPATVTLTAYNARGGRVTQSKTVEPLGTVALVSFDADQTAIATGGTPVQLTWNVTNARTARVEATVALNPDAGVLADGGAADGGYLTTVVAQRTGAAAENGSLTVYPNNSSVTYTLVATNEVSVPLQQSRNVSVATAAEFIYSTQPVPSGATIQVTGLTTTDAGTAVTGLPYVELNRPGESFIDIVDGGTSIAYAGPDTTAKLVTLPEVFTTVIGGTPVSGDKISISINGWFFFSNLVVHGPDNNNTAPLPSAALEPLAIAPFWDDLYDTAESEIYYRLDGVGPDRRLIVQWNQVEHDDFTGSTLTFQAQLSANGKIVFAYKNINGVTLIDPSVGVVMAGEVDTLMPSTFPVANSTFTFFPQQTMPAQLKVMNVPITARVTLGPDAVIDVVARPQVLPANQFVIAEAMVQAAPGVTAGEWLEVESRSTQPIDLRGWTIDFGGGSTHVIASSVVLPPAGRVLLGQSATGGDGLAVDYVYGPSFSLPKTAGAAVSITLAGSVYTSLNVDALSLLSPGRSVQFDGVGRAGVTYATGQTQLLCASATPFGTNGQRGTPKLANGRCPPYVGSSIAGAFTPIASVGTLVPVTNLSEENVAVTLPRAVTAGGVTTANITVSTNGYLALKPLPCASAGSCYATNRTATGLNPALAPFGLIAPYWDDLSINTGGGIYTARLDPDSTPDSGDEVTIVSWENIKPYLYVGVINFQVKFFDNGNVEFHYGSMTATTQSYAQGVSATTWLEDPLGRSALVVNVNSSTAPGIQQNSGYRFTLTP